MLNAAGEGSDVNNPLKAYELYKKLDAMSPNNDDVTIEAVLNVSEKLFDEADSTHDGYLDYDEYLSLNSGHPHEYLEEINKLKSNAIKLAKSMGKIQMPMLEKATSATLMCFLSFFFAILSAKNLNIYTKKGIKEVPGGKHVMLLFLGLSVLLASINVITMLNMLRRRLNKDYLKRAKYSSDKMAFTWHLMSLIISMVSLFSTEEYFWKIAKDQEYTGHEKGAGIRSVRTCFVSGFLVILLFAGATQSKLNDTFFIGVVRLALAHVFFWLLFGAIILYHGDEFEFESPVRSFSDALYISAITHTTVGYGDVSIGPRTGRKIMLMHAIIVMSLNFVAGLAFVNEISIEDPAYNPDTKSKKVTLVISFLTMVVVVAGFFMPESSPKSPPKLMLLILNFISTAASVIYIIKLLKRRLHDQSHTNDTANLCWFWLMFTINVMMLSISESELWDVVIGGATVKVIDRRWDKVGNHSQPYISWVLTLLLLILIVKISFDKNAMAEGPMLSVSITMILNIVIIYIFAACYRTLYLSFGGSEVIVVESDDPGPSRSAFDALVKRRMQAGMLNVSAIEGGESTAEPRVLGSDKERVLSQSVLAQVGEREQKDGYYGPYGSYAGIRAVEYDALRQEASLRNEECVTTSGLDLYNSASVVDLFRAGGMTYNADTPSASMWQREGCMCESDICSDWDDCKAACDAIEKCEMFLYKPTYMDIQLQKYTCLLMKSMTDKELAPHDFSQVNVDTAMVENKPSNGEIWKKREIWKKKSMNNIGRFSDALYFSVITHTTVGFGDINGANDGPVSHTLTMVHVLLMFFLNMAAVAAMVPDDDEAEQYYLSHLELDKDGHIPVKDLGFISSKVAKSH